MFGYVLVTNKNEVITYGGDERFDDYLQERLHSEILFSSDTPSTSSGVHTDSSTESLCTHERTSISRDDRDLKDTLIVANDEIANLFLPIITVCRSQKSIQLDKIFSMTSEQVTILLRRLRSNYLLICLGDNEKVQHQFMDYVELGLEVNVGPLLELLDTDPSSVTLGWNFLKSLAENHCIHDETKVKGRCILLGNGDVLSSISSDEGLLWKSISYSDLNFLLKQISSDESSKSEELFQVWLRSTKSIIPYYVDVMVSNICGDFKIVCLFEAKYSILIRTITVFLVQLDRIHFSDDVMKDTCEIEKTVESIAQQLLAFSSSNSTRRSTGGGYMKNPERTAYFIEKSTLKCDITMEYFRRQAVNILQELCFESHRITAPQKLAQFRKIISRVIDTSDGSVWSDVQLAMTLEKRSTQLKEFLSPLSLGLDMVAYSVTIPAKSISVTYTPDWIRDEFESPLKCSPCSGFVDLMGRSGKRYNLFRTRTVEKRSDSWMNILKSFRTYLNGRSNTNEVGCEYVFAVALFEEGINKELAEREILKLIEIVVAKMYSSFSFVC
ncbi:hypothetical protein NECAME_04843 [Necator americanus]|uniref:Uncharacterized protein n=1 Tax=Necator americanus TaxID=51031 RepID=W2SM26_NECAM|nr:hypothetical protein NECAME_04843 [Necator americanus]ETN70685.1 hypothetical protein NECAME_04843 [Necator americanus]